MSSDRITGASAELRAKALSLLASREHSYAELGRKLEARGFESTLVEAVLRELREQRLQCDSRFAESYVQSRVGKGDGPIKIRHRLRERAVDDAVIRQALGVYQSNWIDQAAQARNKRFGPQVPVDYRECARQSRFLEQRGFTAEQIRFALKADCSSR